MTLDQARELPVYVGPCEGRITKVEDPGPCDMLGHHGYRGPDGHYAVTVRFVDDGTSDVYCSATLRAPGGSKAITDACEKLAVSK